MSEPRPLQSSTALSAELLEGKGQIIDPGTVVGEYRVEEMLGEGTFGHVYLAVHPIIGRRAAIKVLKPSFSRDPEMLSRFIEEARAANRIRHRGIIDIFGFGSLPDGRSYYVMEALEGITLDAFLGRRGAIDLAEALPILRAIARAMDAAHAASVIHRDLKPANVFLCMEQDQNPRPKILDFGIAKLLSSDTGTSTRSGTPLGTPHYMSPEQCRGLNVNKATDVYAFGVMVFEMLTGQMPFDAETGMDILLKHISEPPPRPSDVNKALPPALNASILQMLAKDPGARPSSLTVAVEDLATATGHTWALVGPRNSSHSALAAITHEQYASIAPQRMTPGSMRPITSATLEPGDPTQKFSMHAVHASQRPTVPAPLATAAAAPRSRLWMGIAAGVAVALGALTLALRSGSAPSAASTAPSQSVTQTAETLDAPVPATAAPAPVVSAAPALPSASAAPAVPAAAAPAAPASPAKTAPARAAGHPRKTKEIDTNPY